MRLTRLPLLRNRTPAPGRVNPIGAELVFISVNKLTR